MTPVHSAAQLAQLIAECEAVLVLFGGAHCGVCQVVKPQLARAVAARFPRMRMVYVDAEFAPEAAAQASVFSLPVVRVYFDRQLTQEAVKAFSVGRLMDALARPYVLRFGADSDECRAGSGDEGRGF